MVEKLETKEKSDKSVAGGRSDKDDGREKLLDITVIYNGVEKALTVDRDDLVRTILARVIVAYGSPPNPHVLSLYNEKGEELKDAETMKDAKVKKRDRLLLRPSTVKAG